MNLIMDDVEEVNIKKKNKKSLGGPIFSFFVIFNLPNVHTLKSGTSILFRVDYLSEGKMFGQNLLKRCNATTTSLSLSLSL